MDEHEYQAAIPIFCRLRTVQEHIDVLGLCWGITYGYVSKLRGEEGPQYCQSCPVSNHSKRYHFHMMSDREE